MSVAIWKQPLLHFLLLGLLLFALFDLTARQGPDPDRTIRIDRTQLLSYMQYQARAFETGRFESLLDQMSEERRQALIADFVREEALYREAVSLGLEANDYVIRQRLIQKVEYLARGFEPPTEVDLENYYRKNQARYIIPAAVTFTHVFVNSDNYLSREVALAAARALLQELEAQQVNFADALKFGEPFALHRNYVDRTREAVASHFGEAFATAVFQADFATGEWLGPIESAYGWHLVLIGRRQQEGVAPFAEVAAKVRFDAEQAVMDKQAEAAIQKIIDGYELVLDL